MPVPWLMPQVGHQDGVQAVIRVWCGILKRHLCLFVLLVTLSSRSWQSIGPHAGSLCLGRGPRASSLWGWQEQDRHAVPFQHSGLRSCLSSEAVLPKVGCTWQSVGVQGENIRSFIRQLIHICGGYIHKRSLTGMYNQNHLEMLLERRRVVHKGRKLLFGGDCPLLFDQHGHHRADGPVWCSRAVSAERISVEPMMCRAEGLHPGPARCEGLHLASTWLPLRGWAGCRWCRAVEWPPSAASVGRRGAGFVLTRNFLRRRFGRTGARERPRAPGERTLLLTF